MVVYNYYYYYNLLQQPTATTYYNNLLQTTYYNYYEKGWVGRAGAGRRGSGAGLPGGGGFHADLCREKNQPQL